MMHSTSWTLVGWSLFGSCCFVVRGTFQEYILRGITSLDFSREVRSIVSQQKLGIFFHRTKKICSLVDIRQLQTMLRSPEMSASSGEEDSWHEISSLCSKKSELFLVFLRCGGDLYSNRQEFAPMDLADVRMVLHSRSLPQQLFHPWKIWVLVEPQEIDDERNSEFVMQENVPWLNFLNFVAWWLRIGERILQRSLPRSVLIREMRRRVPSSLHRGWEICTFTFCLNLKRRKLLSLAYRGENSLT